LVEKEKFISGNLIALSSMINLGLPHLTILSKCDLVGDSKKIDKMLSATTIKFDEFLPESLKKKVKKRKKNKFSEKFSKLTESIEEVLNNYGLISH